jgi:hypothetical protein
MNPEEVTGICSCCGQALKYSHLYAGKVWGGQCLATHLGCSVDALRFKGKELDTERMAAEKLSYEQRREAHLEQQRFIKEVAEPRLAALAASPLVIQLVQSFNPAHHFGYALSSATFRASILCQLFEKGSLSDKQLAAVAKSLRYSLTEADATLTERVKTDGADSSYAVQQLIIKHNPAAGRYFWNDLHPSFYTR